MAAGGVSYASWLRFMRSHPKDGIDMVPFLDLLLIGVFVSLNFSLFVSAPGIAVTLPNSPSFATTAAAPLAVLTIDRNELYFFEGQMLTAETLRDGLQRYLAQQLEGPHGQRDVGLLLKSHRDLPSSVLIKTMDLANDLGFTSIHIAAENHPGAEPLTGRTRDIR